MICFRIDELTPCLKNVETGEIYETEVIELRRKSFLSKFNKRTGWYVNWGNFAQGVQVYALVIKGTMDIQGMVAIENDDSAGAIHVVWACTAPENNIWENKTQKYSGVGGHLFAIASELSVQRGYDGFIYGEAMDHQLFEYYQKEFGAFPVPARGRHPYTFMLTDNATQRIREVYDYVWTDDQV
jgi:hypothetical protein